MGNAGGLMFKVRGAKQFSVRISRRGVPQPMYQTQGTDGRVVRAMVSSAKGESMPAMSSFFSGLESVENGDHKVDLLARLVLGIVQRTDDMVEREAKDPGRKANHIARLGLIELTGVEGVITMLMDPKITNSSLAALVFRYNWGGLVGAWCNEKLLPVELDMIDSALQRDDLAEDHRHFMTILANNNDPRVLKALEKKVGEERWSIIRPYIEDRHRSKTRSPSKLVRIFDPEQEDRLDIERLEMFWPFMGEEGRDILQSNGRIAWGRQIFEESVGMRDNCLAIGVAL